MSQKLYLLFLPLLIMLPAWGEVEKGHEGGGESKGTGSREVLPTLTFGGTTYSVLNQGNLPLPLFEEGKEPKQDPLKNPYMKSLDKLELPEKIENLSDEEGNWDDALPELRSWAAHPPKEWEEIDRAAEAGQVNWPMLYEEGTAQGEKVMPFGILMPHLGKTREVAKLRGSLYRLALERGDAEEAAKQLRRSLLLGEQVGSGYTLIEGLVGVSIDSLAKDAVSENIDELDSAGLEKMLSVLSSKPPSRERLLKNLQGEKAFGLGTINYFLMGNLDDASGLAELSPKMSWMKHLPFPLIRLLMPDRSQTAALENFYDGLIELHGKSFADVKRSEGLKTEAFDDNPILELLAPQMESIFRSQCESDSKHSMLEVGLALKKHQLETGHWPESLDELPLDVLGNKGLDAFSGNRVRMYRGARGVGVYALGENLEDNGGDPDKDLVLMIHKNPKVKRIEGDERDSGKKRGRR